MGFFRKFFRRTADTGPVSLKDVASSVTVLETVPAVSVPLVNGGVLGAGETSVFQGWVSEPATLCLYELQDARLMLPARLIRWPCPGLRPKTAFQQSTVSNMRSVGCSMRIMSAERLIFRSRLCPGRRTSLWLPRNPQLAPETCVFSLSAVLPVTAEFRMKPS